MRRLALAALAFLLAGCGAPDPEPLPAVPSSAAPAPQRFDLNVRVGEETPDGAPIAGAEVVAYPLGGDGKPGAIGVPAATDTLGVARFTFHAPTRIALRATAPGWTAEGTTVAVAEQVTVGDGLVASERDVFLPLYRTELRLSSALTLSTQAVAAGAAGGLDRPAAFVPLALPGRAAAEYLARLAAAEVRVAWADTATERADLSAGLGWDGRVWVEGEPAGPGLVPGDRAAEYAGPLPPEGRPADLAAATLQAAVLTNSAVVGDVPLAVGVRLRFDGRVPPGLPAACHAAEAACLPALPPAPPVPPTPA